MGTVVDILKDSLRLRHVVLANVCLSVEIELCEKHGSCAAGDIAVLSLSERFALFKLGNSLLEGFLDEVEILLAGVTRFRLVLTAGVDGQTAV